MIPLLIVAALAADPEETPEQRGSWFSQIRYGIGVSSHFGVGTDGTTFGRNVVAEPLAFELRSFLWPRVAFHTTLYLGRMIAPPLQSGDGRIDYGCHLGGHAPLRPDLTFVIAPGADIAYSITRSGYQRFTGDARIGVDVVHGRWTTGFYLRPYGGWWRDAGETRGRAVGGALLEIVNVFSVPKRGERAPR
ncbi:MAG TPA: hypothetical protein PKA64_16705 [Myxococcota bacterium]|nr:hypothetical protein [Myxococcota bacterium]